MIVVHHLNNSRSQRVLWLLEELGVPYEVKRYERNAKTMLAPPELRAVHPLGKSPVITDGDITVAETGAIADYLVETYGKGRLIPKAGTQARRDYTYWLHYAEGSAMPPFLMKLIFARLPTGAPALIRPIAKAIANRALTGFINPQIKHQMTWWETSLAKSGWFAGDDFTAADIMMSFPAEVSKSRGVGLDSYPNIQRFLNAIHARPAYQRALERGGAYDIIG
jgi:glutathione S-transferase